MVPYFQNTLPIPIPKDGLYFESSKWFIIQIPSCPHWVESLPKTVYSQLQKCHIMNETSLHVYKILKCHKSHSDCDISHLIWMYVLEIILCISIHQNVLPKSFPCYKSTGVLCCIICTIRVCSEFRFHTGNPNAWVVGVWDSSQDLAYNWWNNNSLPAIVDSGHQGNVP